METSPIDLQRQNQAQIAEADALIMLCKASADQLRLNILRVLSRDSFGVLELCSILDYKQSGLSHHLKILAKAGLVNRRREGNTIFYRRAHQAMVSELDHVQQSIFVAVDKMALSPDVEQRLTEVKKLRAERSRAFFSRNADQFIQQQEQIAAYELYGVNAAKLILNNAKAEGNVLEVGPGEGDFLSVLAPHFKTVYALDNSEQMLNKARQNTEQQGFDNIEFIHGDTQNEVLKSLKIDSIVVNMVLHHIASPADMFFDLADCLSNDGRLFATDLCSHNETWVQEACGDLWQGFEPEELSRWAAAAGFNEGQSLYLTQLNGFRVQVREFIKP